jgi:hypothetical protein
MVRDDGVPAGRHRPFWPSLVSIGKGPVIDLKSPDPAEQYASHRPSGEICPCDSIAGVRSHGTGGQHPFG